MPKKEIIIQFKTPKSWRNCYTESFEDSKTQYDDFKKLIKRFQFNNPGATYQTVLRETIIKDEVITIP